MIRKPAMIMLRGAQPSTRLIHTTSPARSALFNLGGLAASREGQYLSRERGIPRTEYSSNIHLIRSSEVDPFAPAPGASRYANASMQRQRERLEHEQERTRNFTHTSARPDLAQKKRLQLDAASASAGVHADHLGRSLKELTAEVERLRSTVSWLQERHEANKSRVSWLSTFVSLFAGTTAALWYSMRTEATTTAPVVPPPFELSTQPELALRSPEATSPAEVVTTPVAAHQTTTKTVHQEQSARGFLESLFWSSRQRG